MKVYQSYMLYGIFNDSVKLYLHFSSVDATFEKKCADLINLNIFHFPYKGTEQLGFSMIQQSRLQLYSALFSKAESSLLTYGTWARNG